MVRRGLRLVLDSEPDLEVVAEAGNGAEAVEAALAEGVDLAVLDWNERALERPCPPTR